MRQLRVAEGLQGVWQLLCALTCSCGLAARQGP